MRPKMTLPAVLAMGTVGEVFIYLVPILLGSVVESFGLEEGTAGILIGLEVGASAVAALLLSPRIGSLPIRAVGLIAIAIVIVCDFLSSLVTSIPLFVALRVLAAFGAGALFAMANALAATTAQPERTYALIGLSLVITATLGFTGLTFSIERLGPQSAFAVLALLSCAGVPFLLRLPRRLTAGPHTETGPGQPALFGGMAGAMLLGTLLLFVAQNSIWVFVERIGSGIGIPLGDISTVMILNGFIAFMGPLAAHWLGTRLGRTIPVIAGIAIQMVAIAVLACSTDIRSYGVSVIALSLAFVFVIPFLRGVMARLDQTGRVVGASTAFVSLGAAVGPGFGGIVLNAGGSYVTLAGAALGVFVVTLMLVVPVALWSDKQVEHAEARAASV